MTIDETVVIEGVVIPAGWDEDDRVVALSISTVDERELLVEDDSPEAAALLTLLRRRVLVEGHLLDHERVRITKVLHIVEPRV